MKYPIEHYRDFENTRLIYEISAGAEIQAEPEAEPTAPEKSEKRTPEEIWDQNIEPEWGIDAFKVKIEANIKEGMGDKERFVKDAVDRYKRLYEEIKRQFFADAKKLEFNKRDAIKRAEKEFNSRESLLKDAVSYDLETKDSEKSIGKHVDALNNKYLNYEWVSKNLRGINEREPWNKYFKGIPIFYPFIEKNKAVKKYEELADKFQKNMKKKIMAQYGYLKNQEDMTPEMLKTFRDGIEKEYKKFANLDKKSGMIDFRDLLLLEHYASGNPDLLEKLTVTGGEEKAIQLMEATQLIKPKNWKETIDDMKNALLRDTEHGCAEGQFINATNAYRGEEAEKFTSFKQAKDYFEETLDTYSKFNIQKTLGLIKHFDSYINKNRVEFIGSIDPPSIRGMVYRERKRLLEGRYDGLSGYDEILVKFIRSDRERREEILNNEKTRQTLFKSIQNTQVKYTEIYEDRYQDGVSEEIKELRTRSKDREKPTYHDQVARLLALISLGNEAEGIIKNLSENKEYKDIHEKLKNVKADEHVMLALKFKDNKKSESIPYRSSIFRGGFNGRDLGVKALKIAGAMTVVVNIANSFRQGFEDAEGGPEGEPADFFDKIAKSIEYSLWNPAVAAGAAAAVGGQMLENHPQYYSYLKADELGKYEISTTASLERLSQKVGTKNLKTFIGNEAEWKAMEQLDKDKVQGLMTKAEERANESDPPRVPGITATDLEDIIPDKTITTQLTKGGNHLRYIFFSKFLNRENMNVAQLNEACKGWA